MHFFGNRCAMIYNIMLVARMSCTAKTKQKIIIIRNNILYRKVYEVKIRWSHISRKPTLKSFVLTLRLIYNRKSLFYIEPFRAQGYNISNNAFEILLYENIYIYIYYTSILFPELYNNLIIVDLGLMERTKSSCCLLDFVYIFVIIIMFYHNIICKYTYHKILYYLRSNSRINIC